MRTSIKVVEIFCKMCKRIQPHMDLFGDGSMWKCVSCGEYNKLEQKGS